MRRFALVVVTLAGCAGSRDAASPAPRPAATPAATTTAAIRVDAATASPWAETTRSPQPVVTVDPRAAALATACSGTDAALERVARELAAQTEPIDSDELAARLRQHGEPHVRPRLVTAVGRTLDAGALHERLAREAGPRGRCGVAFAARDEGETMIALIVDALADLEPLPTRARTGEWLTFSADLRVAARNTKLVVLGPRGAPRTVPTALVRPGHVQARFALDAPGAFTVQLIGDAGAGPRPLLEARLFADVEPFEPASGDTSEEAPLDPPAAVAEFVRELRARESLRALTRDRRLDELAFAHAEAMQKANAVQHDLGDGDLARRFETAGLSAKVVGENVARGRTLGRAHRALDASPSHRMNLLRADYTHIGVAAVTGATGTYVCQVFAAGLR